MTADEILAMIRTIIWGRREISGTDRQILRMIDEYLLKKSEAVCPTQSH